MTILLCLRSQPGWITLYTEHVQWMADYAKEEINTQPGHFDLWVCAFLYYQQGRELFE